MIFTLADQISVSQTPSTAPARRLSTLLTRSAKRGLKRANIQKNQIAKGKTRGLIGYRGDGV